MEIQASSLPSSEPLTLTIHPGPFPSPFPPIPLTSELSPFTLVGTDMDTLLYLKQITNKDQLFSTGNTAQYSEKKCKWEKSLKKNRKK